MAPIFKSMAIVALSIFSVLGSPIEQAEGVAEFAPTLETRSDFTPLEKRADFQWRFYDNGGCDHNSNPSDTFPSNGSPPGQGTVGNCYSAPTGIDWNRVEIDIFFGNGGGRGLQTFCNVNCGGGASVKQQGTNCYLPISGCAIGSFRVIN
ncbi:hypothetical protein P154DRAFT_523964 [Amniculicola lignicola CBS 123094]|uniref:Uncharacterized protein n=1 Tax=Amniculicola lignicola CBS 123094 TaxID=1392246 RepID=A0A6A5WCP7_9PLEO|nr:hypothetical protein P154DRAFT_523964 [Amniculicola lignicola CBS 123094]